MGRKFPLIVGLIGCLSLMLSCVPRMGRGPAAGRGGNSILADIGGLSPDDRKLPNIAYALVCDESETTTFKVPSTAVSDTEVSFPGDKIKDGNVCAMEITADVPQNDGFNYRWYSSPEQPGLFYSSDKGVVSNRALSLRLYKLYGREGGDIFLSPITVSLEVSPGDVLPPDGEMLANIECGTNENFVSSAPTAIPGQPAQKLFTFRLSATKMRGASCNKIVVRKKDKAGGYENAFEGALTGVTFVDPKVSTTVAFGPFALKKAVPANVSVQTIGAVECTKFNTATRKCQAIRLPHSENFWLAVVTFKRADNSLGEVLVSGRGALALDKDGRDKALDDIKAAAAATTSPGYTFFDVARKTAILSASFDATLRSNTQLQPQAASTLGVNNVSFESFKEVYVHGFKEVAESELNKNPTAIWFAQVDASSGAAVATFVITGNLKYFASASKGAQAGAAFFTWEAFKADRDSAATDIFRAYGVKSGSVAPAGCNNDLSYYQSTLSGFDKDMLSASNNITALEACEIKAFPKTFDTWNIKVKSFLWAWHQLVL